MHVATACSNAALLKWSTADDVSVTVVNVWEAVYQGYPNIFLVGGDSIFTFPQWTSFTDSVEIQLQLSGVESHNCLGLGERYHGGLLHIFHKVREEVPGVNFELPLRLSIKSKTNTICPAILVLSYLVFRLLLQYAEFNSTILVQAECLKFLKVARSEMAPISTDLRIKQALLSLPPAAYSVLHAPGDKERVYRDIYRRMMGPFSSRTSRRKNIFVL